MGRWARGDEISCNAGRCPNLAEWTVRSDVIRGRGRDGGEAEARKTWVFCWLHKNSSIKLLRERHMIGDSPDIEPFQDASQPAPTKRKHSRKA